MEQEKNRSNPSNPPSRYAGSQFNNNNAASNQNYPSNVPMQQNNPGQFNQGVQMIGQQQSNVIMYNGGQNNNDPNSKRDLN